MRTYTLEQAPVLADALRLYVRQMQAEYGRAERYADREGAAVLEGVVNVAAQLLAEVLREVNCGATKRVV